MSKILDATCESNVVLVQGIQVPVARVLSEGIGPSEGVLLMEEDKATYITSSAEDLKETIEKLIQALSDVTTALTAIDTRTYIMAVSGGTVGAPVATAAIAQVASTIAELSSLKEVLK